MKQKRFSKDTGAVSPVVATLMLVLVAAGAAVGLNVFMQDFQEKSTDDIRLNDASQSLSIAGSSTVYEFSLAAIPGFEAFMEQRGTPVSVELESGGSGAGRQAVGNCLIDIGSSSSPVKDSEKKIWPDCDRDGTKDFGKQLEIYKVATDGVVFAVDPSNTHCSGVPALTEDQAYSLYYHNGDNFGTTSSMASPVLASDLDVTGYTTAADGATTDGSTTVTGTLTGIAANDRIQGAGIPSGATVVSVDTPDAEVTISAPATATASGIALEWGTPGDGDIAWSEVPDSDGGSCTGAALVEIFDRKDPGGTSEIASEKLFGQDAKQLESFGVTLDEDHQGDGNQGVWDLVEGNGDAIFFTSYGYAKAQSATIAHFGTTNPIEPTSENIGDESYDATRPILYITAGEPSPIAQLWLDYVLNAHNNQLLAEEADFESIY